jgi:hypothetical protein
MNTRNIETGSSTVVSEVDMKISHTFFELHSHTKSDVPAEIQPVPCK